MADTINDLILDIEKRMSNLGYTDFGILHNKNHDLKTLKELKRKIMDEARDARDAKKERSKLPKALREVIVKLSKVYKKDLYIYNGVYSIPGIISDDSLKGKFLIKIKEEYQESIKDILFNDNENTLIFIRDISELKNIIDENLENKDGILPSAKERGVIEICDEDKSKPILEKMNNELDTISEINHMFIPLKIDEDSDPDIVSLKKIFEIRYKNLPSIECNIQLFPFYTEKEKPFIEYMSMEFTANGNVNLYYAIFHIDYLYFDIFLKIYYF